MVPIDDVNDYGDSDDDDDDNNNDEEKCISFNLAIFKARTFKFYRVVDQDITYRW